MKVLLRSMLVRLHYCSSAKVQKFPVEFVVSCFVAGPLLCTFSSFLPPFYLPVWTGAQQHFLRSEMCSAFPVVLVHFPRKLLISIAKLRTWQMTPTRKALLSDSNRSSKVTIICYFCMLSVVGKITVIVVSH